MKNIFLSVLFLAAPLWAGQQSSFPENPKLQDEFVQNYYEHRFPRWVNARGSSMTVTWAEISSGTASSFTILQSTITNLHVTGTLSGQTFGKLVQLTQGTSNTQFTTTSNTYQATGLSHSITPTSASNRVLIQTTCSWQINAAAVVAFITIKRGSTDIGDAGGNGFLQFRSGSNATSNANGNMSIVYLDSPNTTSSTTYQVYIKNDNNSTLIALPVNTPICTMILAEVAQ